ncbi:SDR family oxidoreductase [Vibrio sp. Vb2880]|uniref:SDR family NAD(P)-dependent oxidoreductase n=1 Tax=Vibrio TaxID=662 RepID=UPI000200D183|nr:SDR family oxidoreductase [Vibrio furnissii]ADT85345.1 3-oxoacyl-(acyl carrier protein) reductase [Vibrio furnissii NCTC 11218]MBO0215417.1 SDR family oxidoreductase [Vibrio sp. Vb2880]MBY7894590.1 SDR family oxidoreductase [Vibrio fluvialis]
MSKLFLVTGASSGIGLATCRVLLESGHRVIGVSRTRKPSFERLLSKFPEQLIFKDKDLSQDIDMLPRWVLALAQEYGHFSGFVHAAGVLQILPNRFNQYSKMKEVFDLNLFSGLMISRGIADRRVASTDGSSIVLVASIAANIGASGTVNYGASKASLIGASKSLAKELACQKIRVNTISPGLVRTELTERSHEEAFFTRLEHAYPLGLGAVNDIAFAIEFLLSDKARWVTGTDLVVDGGISLGINE